MDHLEHAPNESSLYTSGCTPASASAKTGGRSPDARHTNPQRFSAKLRGLLKRADVPEEGANNDPETPETAPQPPSARLGYLARLWLT
eukprot:CAMPEP_0174365788 /NCGR_PEP_ID=MMETSP0811_2-20130205/78494_1 /TAXON_ID=73025 ORGANISM="Eutreptiella gymnastica-like, Strain CCMP1594" /NCGR_SAMPLE_ID=MMETSP0811_2 /ASSEMBLY_ACC=CAM_ASM_000667 /LENGTH=87 /DNA_ID=CAMNT_0015506723 /DNA_START=587 /DNA_END=848 /DNA_ORIENTATION=+